MDEVRPSLLTVERKHLSLSPRRHLLQVVEELTCGEQRVSH